MTPKRFCWHLKAVVKVEKAWIVESGPPNIEILPPLHGAPAGVAEPGHGSSSGTCSRMAKSTASTQMSSSETTAASEVVLRASMRRRSASGRMSSTVGMSHSLRAQCGVPKIASNESETTMR